LLSARFLALAALRGGARGECFFFFLKGGFPLIRPDQRVPQSTGRTTHHAVFIRGLYHCVVGPTVTVFLTYDSFFARDSSATRMSSTRFSWPVGICSTAAMTSTRIPKLAETRLQAVVGQNYSFHRLTGGEVEDRRNSCAMWWWRVVLCSVANVNQGAALIMSEAFERAAHLAANGYVLRNERGKPGARVQGSHGRCRS